MRWKIAAIDGLASSGKSTLARQLAKDLPDVHLVAMDDFFLPALQRRAAVYAKNYDLERLLIQVIEPVLSGRDVQYQRFNWATGERERDFTLVPTGSKILIDGLYSMDIKLFSAYDFTIWVDTPDSIRQTRALDQGVDEQRVSFGFDREELIYQGSVFPKQLATLVLSGASKFPTTAQLLSEVQQELASNPRYTQRFGTGAF